MDGYTLTLAANPWNIVRTQLCGAHVRGRQRLRPIVRQLRGLEHGQDVLHSAAKRSGKAALRGALPGAGPAQPDGRNGGRLRPPDPGWSGGGGDGGLGPAAEFLDGGADDVTLATLGEVLLEPFSGALQQPELRGLGQLRGGRLPAGGLRHDPERGTLRTPTR